VTIKCPKCQSDNPETATVCADCGTKISSPKNIGITRTMETTAEEFTRGTLFAERYEIIEELGRGGMGKVYLAHDNKLDRDVALKFLDESIQKDNKARERLIREAKSAAALDHPFICKIYDSDETEGKAFISMEFVEGESLNEKIRQRPLNLNDIFRIISEVAEALEVAHKKGIIHRDLKPSNIMITPQGHAKVMDFGIAKWVYPEDEPLTGTITKDTLTHEGSIVGTLAYMSPEQARGERVDIKSDIFSLGIIFYELISGKQPFVRANTAETLSAILRDPPLPISVKPKKLNPVVDRILQKSLEKDPQKRYRNVSEFYVDVKNAQGEIAAKGLPLFRGWPTILLRAASIALILIGILWLTWFKNIRKTKEAPEPIRVLVADFQNRTGDQVFEGALEQAFCIGLEGAPNVSVYKRPQARKIAEDLNPNASGSLDIDVAQLVCRSEGINVVIAGIIDKIDSKLDIKVWALDPVSSEEIIEASKTINKKGEILKATDNLAVTVRVKISGIPKDSIQAIAKETFTTSSLQAMKAYAEAQRLAFMGKYNEAIEEYKRAIEADTDFGRAYSGMAVIYHNSGRQEEAKKYFQMALAKIDRMTEREKHRTRGAYFLMIRDYAKAIEEYTSLGNKFPADGVWNGMLALSHFYARNMQTAFELGKNDAKRRPNIALVHYNLACYALAAGKFETSRLEAQKVLELNPEYEGAYISLALSNFAQGKIVEVNRNYQHLDTLSDYGATYANVGLADLALYEGRLSDSCYILEKGIATDLKNSRKHQVAIKYTMLAHSLILQKQIDRAINAADQAVDASQDETILFASALIYIKGGKVDKAFNLVTELKNRLNPGSQTYAKLIEGEIHLKKKRLPNATRLFMEAQELIDTWFGRVALGRVYIKAEAYTRAYSEFEVCLKRLGEVASLYLDDCPTFRYLPPIYYYLGLAQEGLGSPGAAESYKKFLKIKEKADPGIPEIEDARKRLAGLRE